MNMPKKSFIFPVIIIVISSLLFFNYAHSKISFSGTQFKQGEYYRFLTFPFTHINFEHFYENMIALAIVSVLAFEIGITQYEFFGLFLFSSYFVGLVALLLMPDLSMAGTSVGIYAILGALTIKGISYLSKPIMIPLMLAPLFLKFIYDMMSSLEIAKASAPQFLLHFGGFFLGYKAYHMYYLTKYKPKEEVETRVP